MWSKETAGSILHSKRVASWIYAVLNPLIEAMRRESRQLESGNLSWRTHSRRTEYIRPVREWLDRDYWPILEDFLVENSEYEDEFERHDKLLEELCEKALQFQERVLNSEQFQKLVQQTLSAYMANPQPGKPDLEAMTANMPKYVSEELINNAEQLPAHYTISRYWAEFAEQFRSYRERASFQSVVEAANSLAKATAALAERLTNLRRMLCQEFDLPAAQVKSSNESDEAVFRP